jgi:orotate phosphoribosyltransferase
VSTLLQMVAARRGHFRLESGHHGALWLDLDPLFVESRLIAPFVAELASRIRPYMVSAVCGPLLGGAFLAQLVAESLGVEFYYTQRVVPADGAGLYPVRYVLPAAFVSRLRGQRTAIVDDVMSAGSALRGTFAELREHRADPVVVAALLVLGSTGSRFFAKEGVELLALERDDYELWEPSHCPLCASGVPLEDVTSNGAP